MTISKYLVAKKENSQLKCISLKLRVLIYIEGVFLLLTHPHLTMLLIDIKILQNHAEKNHWILNTLPNGVTHLTMSLIDVINPIKPCTKNKHNTSKLRVKAKVTSDK